MKTDKNIFFDTNLLIVFGVTLISVMGVSSIAPAFPKIIREIDVSSFGIGLLITVFTLPGVLLSPVMGLLADRFGRKKILVPSLFLFGIAGGACFFVRDFYLLLVFRFFQGVGAASLGSMNVTLVGDLYSGKQRTAAMGYNASVLSVGTASYPAIGGALATIGWYYPFLLPLLAIPIGFVVLHSFNLPELKIEQDFKAYFSNAMKSLGNRQVFGIFFASIMMFIIFYGTFLTYFPLYMGHSFGASPFFIGVIMSVMSIATAVISSQLGPLSGRYSERTLLKASFLIYALALFTIPFIPSLTLFFVPALLFGLGHGINFPCIYTLLTELAPVEYRATFMAMNSMIFRLGQTLGPPLMGAVFSLWGIEATFYAASCLSLATFALGFVLIKSP